MTVSTENVHIEPGHTEENVTVEPGDYVLMRLSDTGCGMPPEVRERAFEPFFTTKEQGKGTGLGLATAYGIIKQHLGYIWVDSEPGEGTTFRILLPRTDRRAQKPEAPEPVIPERSPHQPLSVLVVDDETPVARLAARVLRGAGYRVMTAERADEALEHVQGRTEKLDLLLTDVVLPERSGVELYEQVSEVMADLPVLYMSGYTDETVARHIPSDAEAPFLQKPFSPEALLRKVAAVLG